MKPIQKWAHAQRLVEAAHVKQTNMLSWYYSPFDFKNKISDIERMSRVIQRLLNYSHNQLKQL